MCFPSTEISPQTAQDETPAGQLCQQIAEGDVEASALPRCENVWFLWVIFQVKLKGGPT